MVRIKDFNQRAVGRVFQAEGTAKAKKDEVRLGNCKKLLGELQLGLSTCPTHRRPPENGSCRWVAGLVEGCRRC